MRNRADKALAGVSDGNADGRAGARRIIFAQLLVTLLSSLGFAVMSGRAAGTAALIGGLINVAANLSFARTLYRGQKVVSAGETILRFYVGEFVKLFVTVALLALAIGVFKLAFLPLFATFVATLLVFWLALSPQFNRFFGSRT
jgi:ATP synthase protein I